VTLDGKPVAGVVVFVWDDKKESASPIGPDGNYAIMDPALGHVKVVVKAGQGGPSAGPLVAPPKMKDGPALPSLPTTAQGVAPPAKYGSPATTPLSYDVKAGKQTYDIPLGP